MNNRFRHPFIVANYGSSLTIESGVELAKYIKESTFGLTGCSLVVCPPSYCLHQFGLTLRRKPSASARVCLGAQDFDVGTYGTGRASLDSLKESGVRFCLVGHSHIRNNLGDTCESVYSKLHALLENNIRPIVCFGNDCYNHGGRMWERVMKEQVIDTIYDISPQLFKKIVFVFEPSYIKDEDDIRVGTEAIHGAIQTLSSYKVSRSVSVLYGGPLTELNAGSAIKYKFVDGFLLNENSMQTQTVLYMLSQMSSSWKGVV